MQGFQSVRRCVMQNDSDYCRSILTPNSYTIFDRFFSYKLMPCLPTDFTYTSEGMASGHRIVKLTMPAGGGMLYVLRLAFAETKEGIKLDVPASLKVGLGDNWESKINLSEQLYLMMKQNMGDKLTCDMLNGLVKPN